MTQLHRARRTLQSLVCALALTATALAQAPEKETRVPEDILQDPIHTFYLTNVTNQNDAFELVTGLRNMVRAQDRIYFVPSKNAIVFRGGADDLALAQRLITELDRPRKVYKLTYTLAETDNGKRVGVQHFDVVVLSGQKVVLKQGSKVPIATSTTGGAQGASSQFIYLDVGINIDAEIIQGGDRVTLKTKVERSSVAEEASVVGAQDPIIRQTVVEGEVNLEDGKPLIIGSMDVVGSTRHIDVDVVAHTLP